MSEKNSRVISTRDLIQHTPGFETLLPTFYENVDLKRRMNRFIIRYISYSPFSLAESLLRDLQITAYTNNGRLMRKRISEVIFGTCVILNTLLCVTKFGQIASLNSHLYMSCSMDNFYRCWKRTWDFEAGSLSVFSSPCYWITQVRAA